MEYLESWRLLQTKVQQYELHANGEDFILEKDNAYIRLPQDQFDLIKLAQDNDSLDRALEVANQTFDDLSAPDLLEILSLLDDKIDKSLQEEQSDYISLNVSIVSLGIVNDIAYYLRWMFRPQLFLTWSLLLLAVSVFFVISSPFSFFGRLIQPSDIPLFYGVFMVITLIHELGHISAASNIQKQAVTIKFGFYLFMPVFYVDMSHTWKGTQLQRIITSLGGYGIQTIPSCLALAYAYYYQSSFWYIIGFWLIIF